VRHTDEPLGFQSVTTAWIGSQLPAFGDDAFGEFERRAPLLVNHVQSPLLTNIARRQMA